MGDIVVNCGTVDSEVSRLISAIQSEIIDATETTRSSIIDGIADSQGDFMESLKKQVNDEAAIITEVGELLIMTLEFIRSATNSFAYIDYTYSGTKIEN